MAWTHASGPLNPDGDKIYNFSTEFSEPKISFTMSFTSERPQIKYFPLWQDFVRLASSTLIEIGYFIFQKATNGFKFFGALADLHAPYSNEATY